MEKSDDEKLIGIFERMKQLQKEYENVSKEQLIDLLVLRAMSEETFEAEGHKINLWCYVSDKTGLKYLTNELPKKYYPISEDSVYLSEGDINIRVPNSMNSMLPDIKYGDDPVKVQLSVSF